MNLLIRILVSVVFLFFSSVATSDAHTESVTIADAQNVGTQLVANLLSREHMYYGTEALHYSEAATDVGALRFVSRTNDAKSEVELEDRYSALLDDDSPLVSRRAHVDMNVIGIVPLQIQAYRATDEKQYADRAARQLAAYLQYYLDRPTVVGDFHGQAPMLWLATALLN